MGVIECVKADFRGVVQLSVNELDSAGVGLVPSWTCDHVVVGELLLLDIAWDLPARELAEALQPPAIGAIHVDVSGTIHRRGSGEGANNNIGSLRRAYERHRYGPPPRPPYAGEGARALPEPTRRRQALAKVCERWPGVTASKIFTTFGDHGLWRGGQAQTPGGYLRQLLEQDTAASDIVRCPPKSTLHEDLKALRTRLAIPETVRLNPPATFSRTTRFPPSSRKHSVVLGPGPSATTQLARGSARAGLTRCRAAMPRLC
jgi:hypothetical protein